ncbi:MULTISPECIES: metal ABC transporter solute-binding protein, Zn/Mn family [unclassified Oleiphilus]|nr:MULTISPECIES: zinc ABC transporter substrate-binding protein [unclassified Oleiphilus]
MQSNIRYKSSSRRALLSIFLLCLSMNVMAEREESGAGASLQLVATFSVLADMAKAVGGDHVSVSTLVDWGEDAHVYRPSPQNVKHLSKADLLLMNGLGFEGWLARLVAAADFNGLTVIATENVRLIRERKDLRRHSHGHHGEEEHKHSSASLDENDDISKMVGRVDPHAWHSLQAAKVYIRNITNALAKVDPPHAGEYETNAQAYIEELDLLNQAYEKKFLALPASQRQMVVPHNAFAYLARDYGLKMRSLQGISTGGEASAAQIAQVVRQVRSSGVKAIFEENVADNRLIKVVQMETGVNFGGELISGALSHELAPSYLDMMQYNLAKIYQALK